MRPGRSRRSSRRPTLTEPTRSRVKRPEPRPALPFRVPSFTADRLPNGPALRAASWGKRPTVAVSVFFPGAGSASDPESQEGLAEITAEALLSGTTRRSSKELAEAIDDLAVIVDPSAGIDLASCQLSVLERDLEAGLALLAETLLESTFPEEEVERLRTRRLDSLIEQRSEPDYLARERLLDRLYRGHAYGRPSATERSLAKLTRDDVSTFFQRHYRLANATIVLVGKSRPERLLEAARAAFSGFDPQPAATLRNGTVPPPNPIRGFSLHLVDRRDAVQTNILVARPGLARSDPRFPAAVLANQVLGGGASSRLFQTLREEKGLTYGAYSSISSRVAGGHVTASVDCRTDVTEEALSTLLGLVRSFSQAGPTPEEHERAQKYLIGSFALSRETPGSLVQDEIARLLYGLPEDEYSTLRDRYQSARREDVADISRALFDTSIGVVTAVGDAVKIRGALERFGETTLWDADGPRS